VIDCRISLGGLGLVDRDRGSQVVKLTLTRLDYWFAPKKLAKGYTFELAEPNLMDAQFDSLQSHEDAGTSCTAYIDGESMDGALAAPTELKIEFHSADGMDQFTMSQRIMKRRAADVGYIEGEGMSAGGGVTLTVTDDALSSAAHYGAFAWNGSAETLLCSSGISAAALEFYRGGLHKAIVRLTNTHAYTDLWVCAKVLASGTSTVLAEGLWQLWPASQSYQEIGPVAIPPDLAGFDTYGTVDYAIYVKRPAGGACRVDIDFLYLAPAEFVRKLSPIGSAPGGGTDKYLFDSAIDEKTYFLNASSQVFLTHTGAGARFWLYPGYHMAIKIFMAGVGTGTFGLHVPMNVGVWYEPRKRIL
jgi:hypothetical protein